MVARFTCKEEREQRKRERTEKEREREKEEGKKREKRELATTSPDCQYREVGIKKPGRERERETATTCPSRSHIQTLRAEATYNIEQKPGKRI